MARIAGIDLPKNKRGESVVGKRLDRLLIKESLLPKCLLIRSLISNETILDH